MAASIPDWIAGAGGLATAAAVLIAALEYRRRGREAVAREAEELRRRLQQIGVSAKACADRLGQVESVSEMALAVEAAFLRRAELMPGSPSEIVSRFNADHKGMHTDIATLASNSVEAELSLQTDLRVLFDAGVELPGQLRAVGVAAEFLAVTPQMATSARALKTTLGIVASDPPSLDPADYESIGAAAIDLNAAFTTYHLALNIVTLESARARRRYVASLVKAFSTLDDEALSATTRTHVFDADLVDSYPAEIEEWSTHLPSLFGGSVLSDVHSASEALLEIERTTSERLERTLATLAGFAAERHEAVEAQDATEQAGLQSGVPGSDLAGDTPPHP